MNWTDEDGSLGIQTLAALYRDGSLTPLAGRGGRPRTDRAVRRRTASMMIMGEHLQPGEKLRLTAWGRDLRFQVAGYGVLRMTDRRVLFVSWLHWLGVHSLEVPLAEIKSLAPVTSASGLGPEHVWLSLPPQVGPREGYVELITTTGGAYRFHFGSATFPRVLKVLAAMP